MEEYEEEEGGGGGRGGGGGKGESEDGGGEREGGEGGQAVGAASSGASAAARCAQPAAVPLPPPRAAKANPAAAARPAFTPARWRWHWHWQPEANVFGSVLPGKGIPGQVGSTSLHALVTALSLSCNGSLFLRPGGLDLAARAVREPPLAVRGGVDRLAVTAVLTDSL
jgi:hypothetical protein